VGSRASNPAGSQPDHFVGGFDTGQIGAVRRREIVRRACLSGKKDSSIHRRGERRTRVRMARKRVRIGSSRKRFAPPAGFDERAQAGANAAAEQFDKLSDGEIEQRAGSRGLELVCQSPAEKSFDERSAERTQMIATGRGPVRVADQMTVHGQQLRHFDRHDGLVSEAERQHRSSSDFIR
jgi:hypothetical protein